MVGRLIHHEQCMLMRKPNINQGFGQCYSFSLPTTQVFHRIGQVMNIQFVEYLMHFGFKIPGIQVIHGFDTLGNTICIFFLNGYFIFLDGIDDGVIELKNILQHRFTLFKLGILLKKCHCNIFMYPKFT